MASRIRKELVGEILKNETSDSKRLRKNYLEGPNPYVGTYSRSPSEDNPDSIGRHLGKIPNMPA